MKKKLIVAIIALFILTFSFAAAPKQANAIPAFAQKYHFSCAVCHTVFPNLNPFGRAFWRNGFRLPNTNGTPSDATQITQGLSLPNPWPVPISISTWVTYQHYTNENVSPQTDAFSNMSMIDAGGSYKLYTPFADSLSFFDMNNVGPGMPFTVAQIWASLNGIGSGFGVPSNLVNLKIGMPNTAAPYFDKQFAFNVYAPAIQPLNVGLSGEGGNLINVAPSGFEVYGTPGYHLWYKVTVTNDAGASTVNANANGASNAMEYSYQLKEYHPTSMGQLEFGYYGATIAEPLTASNQGSWTNRITDNGFDVDLANNIYELGATYMVQSDGHPYGNPAIASTNFTNATGSIIGNTSSSNGYSAVEVYGRYLLPQIGHGLMFAAQYAHYSWTHKDLQEAYLNSGTINSSCADAKLYQSGTYKEVSNGCTNEGIKSEIALLAEYNLAYNAHIYLEYLFTNKSQNNTLGTGLAFAF